MKIAISGLSGCGNTTACKNVSKALGLKIVNYTFRDLAKEMNLTLDQLQLKSKSDPYYDYLVDQHLIDFATKKKRFVMGSRLAGWLVQDADLRVWLSAPFQERAKRIAAREGIPLEKALVHTKKRDEENHERYKRYYGVDVDDLGGFGLVLDTSKLSAEQVCAAIVQAAKKAKESGEKKHGKLALAIGEKVVFELEKRKKQV